jgi:hypothetical protein
MIVPGNMSEVSALIGTAMTLVQALQPGSEPVVHAHADPAG